MMKTRAIALILALLLPVVAFAQVDVTVEASELTFGYMNVYNLPAPDGDGAFQFGSAWGLPDLTAVFAGDVVTLGPNTIGDPDPYWYIGGGGPGAPGNKIMEANCYAEVTDSFAGKTINFSGTVLSNTLTPAHTVVAFVKDYAPDYSSYNENFVPLTGAGHFSVSMTASADAGRHVQWGFQMVGVNVWSTDVAPYGTIEIGRDPAVATENSTFGGVKALYR